MANPTLAEVEKSLEIARLGVDLLEQYFEERGGRNPNSDVYLRDLEENRKDLEELEALRDKLSGQA